MEEKYIRYSMAGVIVLLLTFVGYGTYTFLTTKKTMGGTIQALQNENTTLKTKLEAAEADKDALSQALSGEQRKNVAFEAQITGIAETVGSLEKLTKTDPELLQKYSRVFFLNEHYIPENLALIDTSYAHEQDKEYYFHPNVLPYLSNLIDGAKDGGFDLKVISAFRSFDTQAELKGEYLVTFGSGANAFSADQGYSEHQLGTTVDFTTPALGSNFTSFENTDAYTWLTHNAHRYGFILSYPEDNTFYQFEPWHWRFVGLELAQHLFDTNQTFYDLNQREIDTYLVSFFD